MKLKNSSILIFILSLFILLQLSNNDLNHSLVYTLQCFVTLRLINNAGYTIAYFDYLSLFSVFSTLLMPIWGYDIFNYGHELTVVNRKTMQVSADTYFNYMIPANIGLTGALFIFSGLNNTPTIKEIIKNLKPYLKSKGEIGVKLIIVGFLSSFLKTALPSSLTYLLTLFGWLRLVGPVYIYYSDFRFRKQILQATGLLFFLEAILSGMFGEFVIYSTLLVLIIAVDYKLNFYSKFIGFTIALFFIALLQNVKYTFRLITWHQETHNSLSLRNSSKVEIFSALFWEKLSNFQSLTDEKSIFAIYLRMNQGQLISVVMNNVPNLRPYAEGKPIIRSIGGIILPRFIWADKPEAGGAENMKRFLGIEGKVTYSMNIGPYGEGYGNFGVLGGIVYCFFYGLLLSYLLHKVLKLCLTNHSLIIYLPFLFFYVLSVETDLITSINSFVKAAIFLYFLFWASKNLFKIHL